MKISTPNLMSVAVVTTWIISAIFLLTTFIAPLALVVVKSLGEPFYQHFEEVLSSSAITTIIFRTLRLAAVVTVTCAILGYPAAYAITRLNKSWRAVVMTLIILPFLTSYLVRTYGWIAILGNNGILATTARALGYQGASLNGTQPGLVIAMTHMLLPLMIIPLFTAMQAIDSRQTLASGSLGCRPAETFVRIYYPQTVSGLLSGMLLVFIVSLGFFITPALIGGTSETTVAMIIYSFINELFDWGRSGSLAITLLGTVMVLLLVAAKFVDLAQMFGIKHQLKTDRPRVSPSRQKTGRLTTAAARLAAGLPLQHKGLAISYGFLVVNLLLLVLPLLYVIAVSFQPLRLLALPTNGFSLTWYYTAFNKQEWFIAGRNSLIIAFLATLLSVAVGFFLATRIRKAGKVTRLVITGVAIGPLTVPHIVLALGIYGVFLQMGWTGSIWALSVAHAVVALPYAFINLSNGLAGYDERLDTAAASLGARPLTSLRKVKFPLLKTSIFSAAAFGFLVSFDELIITLFIAGPALPTLPVRMWAATSQNISPELAVVGTVLILAVVVVFAATRLFERNRPVVIADDMHHLAADAGASK
ncbi:ABC transporter permease [Agrobacterium vitis]|uniref:ABC transporter permease n=1 Tax=Agrobacterium vitis TaxID=373 RepID=UPI00157485C2|nr:ABC transporter permease subunit [Agrobacterium vitis]NSY14885.1 ABC transporter permease subunit [Agrobacterium vitis]NSY24642.1 ABC transporter permease subunit [Agrobacterium vitis]WEO75269.1 ABC transporter permease subunit [Agrobacterium vitis]